MAWRSVGVSERETEVAKTDDIRVIKTFQDFHLTPYGLLVALDLLLRNHLEGNFLRGNGAQVRRREAGSAVQGRAKKGDRRVTSSFSWARVGRCRCTLPGYVDLVCWDMPGCFLLNIIKEKEKSQLSGGASPMPHRP